MSLIFVGYVIYSSRQQAKYQEYLAEVATEEAAAAEAAGPEAEKTQSIEQADTTAAVDRDVEIFGASLAAARDRAAETVTMSNDYLTVEFSTAGASMHKVTLAEYTKYAPREERNEKVVRGGAWNSRPKNATAYIRNSYYAWQPANNVGFRVIIED